MLLTNGLVFKDGAFHKGLDVLVQEDRIAHIGEGISRDNQQVVNLQGQFVTPGMIDLHIHGMMGADMMQGQQAVQTMGKALARHGVTGFLPTTVAASAQAVLAALEGAQQAQNAPEGAAVLGVHLEGPFINPQLKGALNPKYITHASVEKYREMTGKFAPMVKQITMAPDIPGSLETAKVLADEGVTVSIGHTCATYDQACEACRHGFTQVTHTFNAQTPIHHRDPGTAGAALTMDELTCEFIADLIHVHPAVLRMGALLKGPQRMVLVSDAMAACGMGDGEYSLGALRVIVKDGQARLPEGNLAGSTLTLDKAVFNMIHHAGIAPEKVIPMATSTPARQCKAHQRGALQAGFVADLCVFDADWHLARTLLRGQWV